MTTKEKPIKKSAVVPIGGKLPLSLEIRSSTALDILSAYLKPQEGEDPHSFRKRLNLGLWRRAKPDFYAEIDEHIHLAYGDQRDGHGTEHYWRIFYDETSKQEIDHFVKSSALTIGSSSKGAENAPFEWGGLYLRSDAERAIAEELDRRGVLFFANVRGRVSTNKSPISELQSNGRVEIDFLVFNNRKAIILEVDGRQHNEDGARVRDYAKDRLMLREGIQTARFTAQECLNTTVDVVNEFLSCF